MTGEITQLLVAWRDGDPEAPRRLFPLVYDELRGMAHRQLRRPGLQGTLDTTALVHEAYLKLVGGRGASVHDRGHFFAIAATAMRQILVDYARRRTALKRGGLMRLETLTSLEEAGLRNADHATRLLEVHEALTRLEALDPRLGQVVELRVFGGLSIEETAQTLALSEATIKREWRKARALLAAALGSA